MYYDIARYYDPATAQFLTVDPMVQQTMQPYGYTAGDPINATDPSGLMLIDDYGKGVGTAAAADRIDDAYSASVARATVSAFHSIVAHFVTAFRAAAVSHPSAAPTPAPHTSAPRAPATSTLSPEQAKASNQIAEPSAPVSVATAPSSVAWATKNKSISQNVAGQPQGCSMGQLYGGVLVIAVPDFFYGLAIVGTAVAQPEELVNTVKVIASGPFEANNIAGGALIATAGC